MTEKLQKGALDLGLVLGLLLFVFGLYLIWHPLAPLVGGLLLSVCCFLLGQHPAKHHARRS